MVVIILENATERLRGNLSRWMIETKPGVFIGTINTIVRERIWAIVKEESPHGALLVYSSNNGKPHVRGDEPHELSK